MAGVLLLRRWGRSMVRYQQSLKGNACFCCCGMLLQVFEKQPLSIAQQERNCLQVVPCGAFRVALHTPALLQAQWQAPCSSGEATAAQLVVFGSALRMHLAHFTS